MVRSGGVVSNLLIITLHRMVKKVTSIEFSCSDIFCFLEDLHKHNIKDKFTVSFDICSLFTNISLHETIDLAVDHIMENDPTLKVRRKELWELFDFTTSKPNFIFQNVIYGQVDGISMGSPLAPTVANLFVGYNEQKWLAEYSKSAPQIYKRYVDDIFATFNDENEATEFFNYINREHPNIKFTKENNQNGLLPFLDVNICNDKSVTTLVFHKIRYTWLLTNFKSFVPFAYKTRLVR